MLKRLLAISYDLILLLSVLFFATFAILPLTNGMAVKSGNLIYIAYLFLCTYAYFAWQWMHGGQTLGMRAWKIKLVCDEPVALTWPIVTRRFMLATMSLLLFGFGFIWALFDKDRLAFHDRFSNTLLVTENY